MPTLELIGLVMSVFTVMLYCKDRTRYLLAQFQLDSYSHAFKRKIACTNSHIRERFALNR